jgi:hypothetical protein
MSDKTEQEAALFGVIKQLSILNNNINFLFYAMVVFIVFSAFGSCNTQKVEIDGTVYTKPINSRKNSEIVDVRILNLNRMLDPAGNLRVKVDIDDPVKIKPASNSGRLPIDVGGNVGINHRNNPNTGRWFR